MIAAYALMCLIWGTTWLGIKVSLHYVAPATGAGMRFILAGLIVYAFAAARGKLVAPRALPWKLVGVLASCLFGINYILTYLAETHVSSGLTAVLFGVLPFFMFGFGHYLLGERTAGMTWAGAAIAFTGVCVISLETGTHGSFWYVLAVVGAALSSAFANVYAKRHSHNDPLATLPPSMLLAGAAVFIFGLLTEPFDPARAFSAGSCIAILYLAIAGSAVAFFLNLWLLKRVRAWIVGMSALIIPVIAVAVGILFGGEHFGVQEGAGAALVIAGVFFALRADARPQAEKLPA
ncbi:MAG: EamA family transporter [Candidatus Baltobacteraceae bacterium]